jgi:hypothetical protein
MQPPHHTAVDMSVATGKLLMRTHLCLLDGWHMNAATLSPIGSNGLVKNSFANITQNQH